MALSASFYWHYKYDNSTFPADRHAEVVGSGLLARLLFIDSQSQNPKTRFIVGNVGSMDPKEIGNFPRARSPDGGSYPHGALNNPVIDFVVPDWNSFTIWKYHPLTGSGSDLTCGL
ncbi:unnamed protein product [Calicophoron daubneyi]|uniref:Uncharacterized protein n=1 Tax=Calicophoron daubneyi TaxID=300641 RepID=A0AAV2TTI7_CALDB